MGPSNARGVRCCTACGAVYRAQFSRCVNDGTELVMLNRDPLVGTTVGPYAVDALIGEGGMGRVYRVHHARLQQKRYALKVLLGDFAATPPMRMRFAKEAQSASRLSHPNVVSVCDFGVTDAGLAYLAMDLVEGTPLSQLIANQPMAPDRVIRLARQLCAGLAHAHDLGLIHRDFKPDNIIVVDTPGGEVPRIADFGLAISNDESDVRLTTSGMVLGTPAYVAPEQCTDGAVDHRADLYALGASLFELLTGGRLPFDGEAAEVVGLKATTAAPTMAEVAPDVKVPPALAAIVDRLLARRPTDRYRDARAVAAALAEAVRFPDDAALARGDDAAPRRDEPGDAPAARAPRAARADDAAIERAVTPAVPFVLPEPLRRRPVTGVRTEHVRAARGSRAGIAIIAGAIVIGLLAAGAYLWATQPRGAPPAVAAAAAATADPAGPREPEPVDRSRDDAPAAVAPAPALPPGTAAGAAVPAAPPPPSRSDRARVQKRASSASRAKRPAKVEAPAPRPAPPAPPAPPAQRLGALPDVPVPPPSPPPPAPPPAPVALAPRLASVDVRGALPNATVQHALDRVLPATRSCRSDRAGAVEVRFAIGESRRAGGMRATGLAAGSCLTAALSGLRTETAPDVGDVEVRVRFTYDQPE